MFSRQPRAATSSEVIGQSVLFGVTCNGGLCRAWPTAGVAGTPSDYGPCYAPDQPLDPRVGGRTTWIHINGHQGPAPLEPTAGVSRRLCARGSDSADWSLYTAGPDNPGYPPVPVRDHIHRLGSGWRRMSGAGQTGMEWVEGGDCSKPSRDGPGPRRGIIGKYRH